MKVTVIGAAGKMGKWFTNYFIKKGLEVTVFDVKYQKIDEYYSEKKVSVAKNIKSACKEAELVLISIPINLTAKTVIEISKHVKENCIVIEIASFKEQIISYCKNNLKRKINYLSLHPMFGPGAKNIKGVKIICITVFNSKQEVLQTKKIFPDANIIPISAKDHDESMAIILSLTQFINFAYASVLSTKNLNNIRKLSGTSFNLQLTIAEAILHDDPEFLATLQIENKYVISQINQFMTDSNEFLELILKKNHNKLSSKLKKLKSLINKEQEFDRAYNKMYEIINKSLET